ncbi:hypothetical protein WBG78_19420 [Chryseolinea sp. T2]|uniref:hypothetical protein n=1 Tax=Chryseolinea sp. T2 TaxID=3129255 RepID=UPI003077B13D
MIIKKLAVPFINEKLLQQVEHCYIATAAISEAGFDFVRTRIPTKTKIEIITGLELPTSPAVLQRIWRNYQGRITLHIHTRNRFNANLYIFDLPYRKSVAFVGSGAFTLEGIKDNEELFYKVNDPKEIENLKSWFVGYYEFGQPLTEELIAEYEWRYPIMKQRSYAARLEREQFLDLTTPGFHWDHIKFKQQFFKKEDYLTLSSHNAPFTTPELQDARLTIQNKLIALHELITVHLQKLGFQSTSDPNADVSSTDPSHHPDHKLRSMWLTYRSTLSNPTRDQSTVLDNSANIKIVLGQKDVGVQLVIGTPLKNKDGREYFRTRMNDVEYRKELLKLLHGQGPGSWIEIACERKNIDSLQTEDALWEFTKSDQWMYFDFIVGKNYSPDAVEISNEFIARTVLKELANISLIVRAASNYL